MSNRAHASTPSHLPSDRVRDAIRAGDLRGAALLALINAAPIHDRETWVDAVLGLPGILPDGPLPRDSVPYLPSGIDPVLAAVRELPVTANDHFVDLGSGLGRVAMLAHLLTGARAVGVEIQPHLVTHARACCENLGLTEVSFVVGNAAEVDLDGSVFYLYAPFGGATRARVLSRLELLARRRPMRLCALGFELHDQRWLVARPCSNVEMSLYASR